MDRAADRAAIDDDRVVALAERGVDIARDAAGVEDIGRAEILEVVGADVNVARHRAVVEDRGVFGVEDVDRDAVAGRNDAVLGVGDVDRRSRRLDGVGAFAGRLDGAGVVDRRRRDIGRFGNDRMRLVARGRDGTRIVERNRAALKLDTSGPVGRRFDAAAVDDRGLFEGKQAHARRFLVFNQNRRVLVVEEVGAFRFFDVDAADDGAVIVDRDIPGLVDFDGGFGARDRAGVVDTNDVGLVDFDTVIVVGKDLAIHGVRDRDGMTEGPDRIRRLARAMDQTGIDDFDFAIFAPRVGEDAIRFVAGGDDRAAVGHGRIAAGIDVNAVSIVAGRVDRTGVLDVGVVVRLRPDTDGILAIGRDFAAVIGMDVVAVGVDENAMRAVAMRLDAGDDNFVLFALLAFLDDVGIDGDRIALFRIGVDAVRALAISGDRRSYVVGDTVGAAVFVALAIAGCEEAVGLVAMRDDAGRIFVAGYRVAFLAESRDAVRIFAERLDGRRHDVGGDRLAVFTIGQHADGLVTIGRDMAVILVDGISVTVLARRIGRDAMCLAAAQRIAVFVQRAGGDGAVEVRRPGIAALGVREHADGIIAGGDDGGAEIRRLEIFGVDEIGDIDVPFGIFSDTEFEAFAEEFAGEAIDRDGIAAGLGAVFTDVVDIPAGDGGEAVRTFAAGDDRTAQHVVGKRIAIAGPGDDAEGIGAGGCYAAGVARDSFALDILIDRLQIIADVDIAVRCAGNDAMRLVAGSLDGTGVDRLRRAVRSLGEDAVGAFADRLDAARIDDDRTVEAIGDGTRRIDARHLVELVDIAGRDLSVVADVGDTFLGHRLDRMGVVGERRDRAVFTVDDNGISLLD